jgi:hypothetical protein
MTGMRAVNHLREARKLFSNKAFDLTQYRRLLIEMPDLNTNQVAGPPYFVDYEPWKRAGAQNRLDELNHLVSRTSPCLPFRRS